MDENRCTLCAKDFMSNTDRERHRVYNAGIDSCWDKWCLSEFGMQAIGIIETNGIWSVSSWILDPLDERGDTNVGKPTTINMEMEYLL